MTTLLAMAFLAKELTQTTSIDSFVQTGITDVTLVALVKTGNQLELKKINKDFGAAFQFKETTLSFKVPLKMRAETKIEDTGIVYVINGAEKALKFGSLHSKEDLANKPGKRQSTVEIGVLTPDLFTSLFDAKFVEEDKASDLVVFDLTFKQSDIDLTRNRVWIDRTKKYVTRRDWFNRDGKQLATFTYSAPVSFNGIWLPTHMEVKNGEDKLAGATDYTGIKVNSGLDDSLFAVK
jgi:outer membrane lipoprotein-sorting protein